MALTFTDPDRLIRAIYDRYPAGDAEYEPLVDWYAEAPQFVREDAGTIRWTGPKSEAWHRGEDPEC